MAPPKRKRRAEDRTKVKRHKHTDDKYYLIKRIVAERRTGATLEYLVDWAGINEETGLAYGEEDQSWVPEQDVTTLARIEWDKRKTQSETAAAPTQTATSAPSDNSSDPFIAKEAPPKRGKGRPRKHTAAGKPNPTKQPAKRGRGRPRNSQREAIFESAVPTAPSPVQSSATASPPRSKRDERIFHHPRHITSPHAPPPHVTIDPRNPSSLQNYLYISQLESQSHAPPTVYESTSSASQSRAASSFRSAGVVLESENQEGELEFNPSASFVPTTQTTDDISHVTLSQPYFSHSSTYEDTVGSASLEESPPSPTLSIPETDADAELTFTEEDAAEGTTIGEDEPESQTQVQSEIADTVEPTVISVSTGEEPHVSQLGSSTQDEFANALQSTPQASLVRVDDYRAGAPSKDASQNITEESPVREIPSTTQKQQDLRPPTPVHQIERREQAENREHTSAPANSSAVNSPQLEPHSFRQASTHRLDERLITPSPEPRIQTWLHLQSNLSAPLSEEQHAQVVPSDPASSTQQESANPETVLDQLSASGRRNSRHDSSQDSPKPSGSPAGESSLINTPPQQSIGTSDIRSNAPRRLQTPTSPSILAIMSSAENPSPMAQEIMDKLEREADAEAAADVAARAKEREVFQNLRRHTREMKLSMAREELEEQAARAAREARWAEIMGTGTRSPSTIPDRVDAPQMPTSLRAVAPSTSVSSPLAAQTSGGDAIFNNAPVETTAEPIPAVSGDVHMDEAQYSDEDGEDESLLNDDVQLQPQEYIVPLPIQGRQADTYREHCKRLPALFEDFAKDPQKTQREIENTFSKLRAIETHVDLVWTGNTISQPDDDQRTRDQHLVQWSYDFSVKFKFLKALLSKLQERDLHVILLVEKEENLGLFKITESFLRGIEFNFQSPETGVSYMTSAEPGKDKPRLDITILSSTSSRITREAHLIVCLDGKPNMTDVRKKPWALNSNRSEVPLLHLVIPRTIGHIDYYLSTRIGSKRKLRAIVATLSQWTSEGEIGHAVNYTPPRSFEVEFADQLVQYLLPSAEQPPLSEWPLPAIGSIKDIIEYQSSQPAESQNPRSPVPGSKAAGKRPLIQDDLGDDPTKRMRFTPQPPTQIDTSHISDSTPGASLSMEQQRDFYKHEAQRLREELNDWRKRQHLYEEMRQTHRALQDSKDAAERKAASLDERTTKLRDQLTTATQAISGLRALLDEQRALPTLSDDDKVLKIAAKNIEIDNLKDDLAKQAKALQDAISGKKYAETARDYVQDRFREAQSEATAARQENATLKEDNAKLLRAQQAAPRKQQHQLRQEQLLANENARLASQVNILQKTMRVKEAELEKVKAEREQVRTTRGVGAGTRAASVGARTPRPGSRAASPAPNGRDRLANLRNG